MKALKLGKEDNYKITNVKYADLESCKVITSNDSISIFHVHKGTATVSVNMAVFMMHRYSMFLLLPGEELVKSSIDEDFDASILTMSKEMFAETLSRVEHFVVEGFYVNRWLECGTAAAYQFISNVFSNMAFFLEKSENSYRYEQGLSQLRCLLCYVVDCIRKSNGEDKNPATFNRLEEHFRKFMGLLTQHYKEARDVSYYADKMFLTPKYLNYISNSVAKRTCKALIDNFIILQLKNELRNTQKTIQEIAYEYNFANQSFLGSYFKKYTGTSPRKFRNGVE